jgi:hypothetical protein
MKLRKLASYYSYLPYVERICFEPGASLFSTTAHAYVTLQWKNANVICN